MKQENKISNEYLEILFAGKNKLYGGYELRNNYQHRLRNAMLATCSIVIVFILLSFNTKSNTKPLVLNNPKKDSVKITTVILPKIPKPKQPIVIKQVPPKQPNIVQVKTNPTVKTTPTIVLDNHQNTTAPSVTPIANPQPNNNNGNQNTASSNTNSNGNSLPIITTETIIPTGEKNGNEIKKPLIATKNTIDKLPTFPGGDEALNMFLKNNLVYPDNARKSNTESNITIDFVVNEDGSISQITSSYNDKFGFTKEGLRVVALMPKWKAGIYAGKPVKCYFSIPIAFVLDGEE